MDDIQDINSVAWGRLCHYIDELAKSGSDEFSPREALGDELFSQIYTLPKSISKLRRVKKVWLYGSHLVRIPPEIGMMESLEYFDPYTSYSLHWFPYEMTRCIKLKDSRVSRRALYNYKAGYKNYPIFPDLTKTIVTYGDPIMKCSICEKAMKYTDVDQYWISLYLGTDTLPLLLNICSETCKAQALSPPEYYIPRPHKGGEDMKSSIDEIQSSPFNYGRPIREVLKESKESKPSESSLLKPLRLIKKIWGSK